MFFLFSLDYLFQLAVQMKHLGIPWLSDIPETLPSTKIAAKQ